MIGTLLILLGIVVRIIAIQTNRNFSGEIKIPSALCTTGIYRFIRHPGYLGSFLIVAGLSAKALNLYGLVAVLLITELIISHRANIEEDILCYRFPEYRDYMENTGRFLPRWRL